MRDEDFTRMAQQTLQRLKARDNDLIEETRALLQHIYQQLAEIEHAEHAGPLIFELQNRVKGWLAASEATAQQSRSQLRRIAATKGEPAPEFDAAQPAELGELEKRLEPKSLCASPQVWDVAKDAIALARTYARDAERWRFLRYFDCIEITYGEVIDLSVGSESHPGERNDAAVDAAMREGK